MMASCRDNLVTGLATIELLLNWKRPYLSAHVDYSEAEISQCRRYAVGELAQPSDQAAGTTAL